MEHVQNKSPNPPTSLSPSCLFRIVHNQAGYSSSARATGSLFAFSKFRPFSGVPAGTLLLTSGVAFFSTALAAAFSIEGVGEGVRGALKGCAAEDEVAAGGAFGVGCEAEEMGVALREGRVVERRRRVGKKCEARWQVRQIMVCCGGCGWVREVFNVADGTFGDARGEKAWRGWEALVDLMLDITLRTYT